MAAYYFGLVLRSFRRSRALTVLVIVLMGCGVAACMTTYAVFRATAADPIPWKSGQLFVPQIDNFGPANNKGEPPDLLAYTDAITVCVMLLLATAAGIVGLSSFWVNQRCRQIGIHRALGATRDAGGGDSRGVRRASGPRGFLRQSMPSFFSL
ncbi:ABC transporter permease [Rhodanobacter koreensis]